MLMGASVQHTSSSIGYTQLIFLVYVETIVGFSSWRGVNELKIAGQDETY
jgi:hypothetical protein